MLMVNQQPSTETPALAEFNASSLAGDKSDLSFTGSEGKPKEFQNPQGLHYVNTPMGIALVCSLIAIKAIFWLAANMDGHDVTRT